MIALFIVYLWTVLRFLRLIVPPNGLIYFTVDYVKKKRRRKRNNKTVEPNMQILQVILHFISANIVCIVKSIPTKENPKRFCTVSNSPFLSLSLSRLKTTEPVDVRGIPQIPPADLQHIPACSEVTASHVLRFSGFVLLSYFQPHRNEKFQKGRGILREM